MIHINEFPPELEAKMPEAVDILRKANLCVDNMVYKVLLFGSRGPGGGADDAADLDLCLVVDDSGLDEDERTVALDAVVETTQECWDCPVKVDVAAIYDLYGCRMPCLSNPSVEVKNCPRKGMNCIGVQRKGHTSIVQGVRIEKIRPCVTVWSA